MAGGQGRDSSLCGWRRSAKAPWKRHFGSWVFTQVGPAPGGTVQMKGKTRKSKNQQAGSCGAPKGWETFTLRPRTIPRVARLAQGPGTRRVPRLDPQGRLGLQANGTQRPGRKRGRVAAGREEGHHLHDSQDATGDSSQKNNPAYGQQKGASWMRPRKGSKQK